MSSPRISVLIPVFNGEALLSRALDSVFAQTYRDFDVLVLDDGSSDGSAEVASRYPVRLIRQENRGIGMARQRLVMEAETPWLAFLDHDDCWDSTKLEKQVPYTFDQKVGLIHTLSGFIFPDGSLRPGPKMPANATALDYVLPDCLINNCTTLFRRDAVLALGGFEDTSKAEDWLMWLKLATCWDTVLVPEVLTWTHRREGSASSPSAGWYEGERRILERYVIPNFDHWYDRYPSTVKSRIRRRLRGKLGAIASLEAEALDREGKKGDARQRHLEAIRRAPTMKGAWFRAARHLVGR